MPRYLVDKRYIGLNCQLVECYYRGPSFNGGVYRSPLTVQGQADVGKSINNETNYVVMFYWCDSRALAGIYRT